MSAWPLIRRQDRSASSMLAAIQCFFIVRFFQCLTRPVVVREVPVEEYLLQRAEVARAH